MTLFSHTAGFSYYRYTYIPQSRVLKDRERPTVQCARARAGEKKAVRSSYYISRARSNLSERVSVVYEHAAHVRACIICLRRARIHIYVTRAVERVSVGGRKRGRMREGEEMLMRKRELEREKERDKEREIKCK